MSDHDPQHDHDDQQPQPSEQPEQPAAICGEDRLCSETAIIGGEDREPQPFDESTIWDTFTFDDENDGKE